MTITIPFDASQLRARCLAKTERLLEGKVYKFIDNDADILAVAHCDTVTHQPTFSRATLEGERMYFSPAMDDRLGVYTILDVLPKLGLKYDILLTDNEERGLTTANDFVPSPGKAYKWMFEFDRRGTGAVYYEYDYTPIQTAGKEFFKTEIGSFSDISALNRLGCGGINVGTGYQFEHTYYCHMILADWMDQVARFVRFYNKHKNDYFPYTPSIGRRRGYYGLRYNPTTKKYDNYDYDSYDDWWTHKDGTTSALTVTTGAIVPFETNDPEEKDDSFGTVLRGDRDEMVNKYGKRFGLNERERMDAADDWEFHIDYMRRHCALMEGEIETCDICNGVAEFRTQETGTLLCENCEANLWWDNWLIQWEV